MRLTDKSKYTLFQSRALSAPFLLKGGGKPFVFINSLLNFAKSVCKNLDFNLRLKILKYSQSFCFVLITQKFFNNLIEIQNAIFNLTIYLAWRLGND